MNTKTLLLISLCSVGFANSFAGQQDHKVNAAQESVASKSAKFGSVSSKDSSVKGALASKDLAGGMKLNGKKGSFVGVVTSVYSPKSHATLYIDFSEPWKNSISGLVKFTDYAKFPLLSTLKGKKVLVTGVFSIYGKDHPEVMVTAPSQIRLVK